jgi:hypothetical protein
MGTAAGRRVERPDGFAVAEASFSGLVGRLQAEETRHMSHSDLESLLEKEGREVLRQLLQAHLDMRAEAQVEGPVVGADGVERTHHRHGERQLTTLLGPVKVEREGHGGRGAKTLFPLDAELNLPKESYSFGVRRRAAEEAAKGSFEAVVEVLAKQTGAEVAKRQVEEVVRRAAVDFDSFYVSRRIEWQRGAAGAGGLLVLTFDGKGVAMRQEDLRPATRAAAANRNRKLEKRLTKGEKRATKRMSQVAAVYTLRPFVREAADVLGDLRPGEKQARAERPKPEGKRVWASVEKEPVEVIDDAFLDACSRDGKREKKWVVLLDGNADQLALVRAAAKRHKAEVTLVLDVIHVLEYLWKAAYVFHAEGTAAAEAWVTERLLWLLCGESGKVVASIRRSATARGLTADERKPADTCANYIEKHKAYVRYDVCLAEGLPIATGVIEGACRHLVKDRMDVTGARWSLAGAEAVLKLRSLRASGDFGAYWRHHEEKELARNHEALYARGELPKLTPPSPSRRKRGVPPLRVVK